MSPVSPPLFIAEVSSNHHQDLDRCREFIDVAADIGCDAVKFQLFRLESLFAPEILTQSETHRARKAWELPSSFIPELAVRCKLRDVAFCCTPFDLEAVEILKPHVDFFKIASYELLWDKLLRACSRTGRPLILSTGMADLEEVRHAVEVLRRFGCGDFRLLHCSSAYPTPAEACNLAAMETLSTEFQCPVGWSDHSRDMGVLFRAVNRWNASIIEFHLDLDAKGAEYEAGHCWLPEQIKPVIAGIKSGFAADGDGCKQPNSFELPDRQWRADPEDGLRPLREMRARFAP
ncbi:N-acetylneuraminate synthase family protein [Sulfidibacter corallicola]|uniref:N-acetylneuraminate synthase family protein n=1 Tax=Sulfidibacter corallicola TaxID=2818388 RepID=A0A8A4TUL4_SULCO|nr:N-acetylneuraminate synthase family protein [Sulfidibacter corallicola]QTD53656.1 N-acetylneuraminate synthase family protein [Sulfidibacter corallicola]